MPLKVYRMRGNMQIHTLDKAGIINELKFGIGISQAVEQGRRADFALLLSMFSNDVRDCTPIDTIEVSETNEERLRKQKRAADLALLGSALLWGTGALVVLPFVLYVAFKVFKIV